MWSRNLIVYSRWFSSSACKLSSCHPQVEFHNNNNVLCIVSRPFPQCSAIFILFLAASLIYLTLPLGSYSGLPGCISNAVDSWIAFFFKMPKSLTFSKNVLCAVRTFALSTSFFSSSMSRLSLARRFWNHVITWFSEKGRERKENIVRLD